MLAFFEYQWIPNYQNPNRRAGEKPGFILCGDTYEELAWDMVEQFFDVPQTQHVFKGGNVGTGALTDKAEFYPSLTKTMRYHERRFTNNWWKRQQWMVIDFLGASEANEMKLEDFKTFFPEDTLLRMLLISMIGRYYSKFHGIPKDSLNPTSAIEWFAELGYLKWLENDDPKVLGNLRL